VKAAEIEPIETTTLSDKHQKWGAYSVRLDIDIP
jgi:hypothetical protein